MESDAREGDGNMTIPPQAYPAGKYVVGVGSANIDLMGRSGRPLVMEDSNPGAIGMSIGGVTHNICANAARLGLPVRLITAVGDDLYAEKIRGDCQAAGIDTSDFLTVPGHVSSTYMSVHSSDGEMAVAVSDMRVLQHMNVPFIESRDAVLRGAGAIVMDTGLPRQILDYVSRTYGPSIPIFIDPVSTTYAEKLPWDLTCYHTVKPNQKELEVLAKGQKIERQDVERLETQRQDADGQKTHRKDVDGQKTHGKDAERQETNKQNADGQETEWQGDNGRAAAMNISPGEALLAAQCARLLARGISCIVVTRGREGCLYMDRDGNRLRAGGTPLGQITNATGAGDSFMSGLIYGRLRRLSIEETLCFSTAVSYLAVRCTRTINPDLTEQAVWNQMKRDGIRAERIH